MIQNIVSKSPVMNNRPVSRPAGPGSNEQQPMDNVQLSTPQASPAAPAPQSGVPSAPLAPPQAAPAPEMTPAPSVPATLLMEGPGPESPAPDPRQEGIRCGSFLRPDPYLANETTMVVHAAQTGNNLNGIREIPYGKFKVVNTAELFTGKNEILIGFGQPKVTTVVPKADGSGYQRLDAAPGFRREARIGSGDTLQSGFFVRLRNLPPEAANDLRAAMDQACHHLNISSARANAKMLSKAGFTSGGKKLSCRILPSRLFKRIVEKGLEFKGQPVKFDIVSTTPATLDEHFRSVTKGEICSVLDPTNDTPSSPFPVNPTDPTRPVDEPEAANVPKIRIRNSRPSVFASMMRSLLGAHTMWEAVPDKARVNIDDYLPNRLLDKFSSGEQLTGKEKLKGFLFTPAKVKFIRHNLAKTFDEAGEFSPKQIAKMFRMPGPGEEIEADKDGRIKYNIVITGDKNERGNRVVIARLKTDEETKADDILTKHVLISGYDQDVRFAGECWAEHYTKDDGTPGVRLHVTNNSGTYRPPAEAVPFAEAYLRAVFPGVEIVGEVVDPIQAPKTKPDYLHNFSVTKEVADKLHDELGDGKKITLHDDKGVEHGFKIRRFKSMEMDTQFYDTAGQDILKSGGMLRTRSQFKGNGALKGIELEGKFPAADGSPYQDRAKGGGFKTVEAWQAESTKTLASRADNAVNLARVHVGKEAELKPVLSKDTMREMFFVSPTTPFIGWLKPSFLVMIDKNHSRPVDEPRAGQPGAQPHEEYFDVTPMIFQKLPWTKKVTPERVAELEDLTKQLSAEYRLQENAESQYQEAARHH